MKRLPHLCDLISVLGISFITVFSFLDVIARYLINKPFTGSNEILQLAMITMITSALVTVTNKDTHIKVSIFDGFIDASPIFRKVINITLELIIFISILLIAFWLFKSTVNYFENQVKTQLLGIPFWLLTGVASFFLSVSALSFIYTKTKPEIQK